MLNKILMFALVIMLCGCQNEDHTKTSTFNHKDSKIAVETAKTDTSLLIFQKFKNSKWIVGEVGVNGEQPDTIIFSKPDTLIYISTDTGKELCYYSFNKDTLTYHNHFSQTDVNSLEEVNCENVNKLHYEKGTFRYIYFDTKCTGEKLGHRVKMDTLDVRFRRI